MSKTVKKLTSASIPDLSGFNDMSDFVLREDALSDSDVDDAEARVELGQNYIGPGNTKTQQRAIRLKELGPRMELRLLKIQGGFCGGDVLFHDFRSKFLLI